MIMQLKNDMIFADSVPADCTTKTLFFLLVILFFTVLVNIWLKSSSAPQELEVWFKHEH